MSESLPELVRDTFFTKVLAAAVQNSDQKDDPWRVLILDSTTLPVVSACMKNDEIMERGITVVEDIRKKRQPMSMFEAIYFVRPSKENIDMIVDDFRATSDRPPRYKAAHLFFSNTLPDNLLKVLASRHTRSRIKTLKEVHMEFIAKESRVFTFKQAGALHGLYSPQTKRIDVSDTIERLASLCYTLGEAPVVRHPAEADEVTLEVACGLQKALDLSPLGKQSRKKTSEKRSQILVLGRGFDLWSPLVHELTYQAAVYDLLPVENDVYSRTFVDAAGRERTSEHLLSEDDTVWNELRHMHISTVSLNVRTEFKKFAKEAEKLQGVKADASQTSDVGNMIKKLPRHREQMQRYGLHIDMATKINKAINSSVEACIRVEQNVSCRDTESARSQEGFLGEVANVIVDRRTSLMDKLRVIMLSVLAEMGSSKRTLDNLLDTGSIPVNSRSAIFNLAHLGGNVVHEGGRKPKPPRRKQREPELELSRWTPIVKDLMEDIAAGKLSAKEYPAVRATDLELERKSTTNDDSSDDEEVASGRKRYDWGAMRAEKAKTRTNRSGTAMSSSATPSKRPKLIVFIVGSVSFNEMRCAYEVAESEGWDVMIGSHDIKTPTEFVKEVTALDQAGTGAASAVAVPAAGGMEESDV